MDDLKRLRTPFPISKVKSCYVIPRPSRSLRSKSGPPTDHNPIVLHLSLPATPVVPGTSVSATTPELPPRTQYHSSKLKDPSVTNLLSHALEDQAAKSESVITALRTSLEQGDISPTQYADKVNTIIVSALQVTADRFLGKTAFRSQHAQKEQMTQRSQQDNGKYSSTHTRIAAKQMSTQTLRNKLRQARQETAPPHIITDLGKSLAKAKHDLMKLQHLVRQKSVTDVIHSPVFNHSHLTTSHHSLWDLLRRYKTDHVQSNLPTQTHDNASHDPRIWKLGPLTLDPQAWHRFRYALGHHLLNHKSSPYNEAAAQKLSTTYTPPQSRTPHVPSRPSVP